MRADKPYTTFCLYQLLFLKRLMTSVNIAAITATCPISTPALKAMMEVKNLSGGKPVSFNELANPNP